MSEVIDFPRRKNPAVARLEGIVRVMTELNEIELRSHEDARRALWIIDISNMCIQVILSDFQDDPYISDLIPRANELTASLEQARHRIHHLGPPFDSALSLCH